MTKTSRVYKYPFISTVRYSTPSGEPSIPSNPFNPSNPTCNTSVLHLSLTCYEHRRAIHPYHPTQSQYKLLAPQCYMHPQNGWLAPLGAFALPALQQSFWIASSIQRSGQRAQCNNQTNICNNHPYFANILHYYMVECPHLPMNIEQVNFCHLSVQLSSVNTQYNPPPISSGGMWLQWRYLSKKRFACLRTVMAECPQNRAPAARPTPLYADTTPSPALNYHYALAAAQISDFLKLHWRAGRGKGSVRTSSGIRLHGQLAICSLAVLTLPRKADQTWEGLLWI